MVIASKKARAACRCQAQKQNGPRYETLHSNTPLADANIRVLRYFDGLLDYAAVEQVDGAIGVARETRIVRHHANRCAFTMQFAE